MLHVAAKPRPTGRAASQFLRDLATVNNSCRESKLNTYLMNYEHGQESGYGPYGTHIGTVIENGLSGLGMGNLPR